MSVSESTDRELTWENEEESRMYIKMLIVQFKNSSKYQKEWMNHYLNIAAKRNSRKKSSMKH